MKRTHNCGELREEDVGDEVTLCGWVHKRRDHGGIIFIDLRDKYGLTQVVFDPEFEEGIQEKADDLRREDVIQVTGKVDLREEGMKNPELDTGEIEVFINDLTILNSSEVPPIEVDEHKVPNEETRFKYRYLDLRRNSKQEDFLTRHKAAKTVHDILDEDDFVEIETPMLLKHTPEGARDYIIPSRLHPGKAYSLPQSPQIYKQILMVSGFDRYYQFARCLRDEDLREDRQPEFTQIDLEMSFVDEEDIINQTEKIVENIWENVKDEELDTPFSRIEYDEAMKKYGTDKPDLRFDLEFIDVTDIVKESDFNVFTNAIENGGKVKCINAKDANFSRNEIDDYEEFAKENGAKGLAWMKVTEEGLESNIVKFFSEEIRDELSEKVNAEPGDVLFFMADEIKKCNKVLHHIRLKLGEDLGLIDEDQLEFVWVTDFPFAEKTDDGLKPLHHPFTAPKDEDIDKLEEEPENVKAKAYDLVLNGIELGGGSIRIHDHDMQIKVLDLLGYSDEEAHNKFGFLLEALKYGAPPHGGLALGFDRLCALLNGFDDIREVIAFPKTKSAENPMDGSPTPITEEHLEELNLEFNEVAKENIKEEQEESSESEGKY